MRNSNYSVGRILLCSPPQNEMIRRNYSRIFIAPVGEGTIDSILFQGYRPIEGFADVAARAIQMASLHDASGSLELKPQVNPSVTGGFLQQFLASKGWLEDDQATVYDVWVEVLIENEDLPDVEMTTFNGKPIEGYSENPLVIAVDVAELSPKYDLNQDDDQNHVEEAFNNNQSSDDNDQGNNQGQSEMAGNVDEGGGQQETGANNSDSQPGRPGRVKNPETDRRLKQNRPQSETAMARRSDTGNDGATAQSGRMAGKPGRVRDPDFDMRLKRNRVGGESTQQAAGGR